MAISPQRLTIYLYSTHRAVIFAIAQLSCNIGHLCFALLYFRDAATYWSKVAQFSYPACSLFEVLRPNDLMKLRRQSGPAFYRQRRRLCRLIGPRLSLSLDKSNSFCRPSSTMPRPSLFGFKLTCSELITLMSRSVSTKPLFNRPIESVIGLD